jgi:hypothetical protein
MSFVRRARGEDIGGARFQICRSFTIFGTIFFTVFRADSCALDNPREVACHDAAFHRDALRRFDAREISAFFDGAGDPYCLSFSRAVSSSAASTRASKDARAAFGIRA